MAVLGAFLVSELIPEYVARAVVDLARVVLLVYVKNDEEGWT